MLFNILNLHGYRGDSDNNIYRVLTDLFPDYNIISPNIDYDSKYPKKHMEYFELLASDTKPDMFVGTSLGGFFAYCLSERHRKPALLINPCLAPFVDTSSIAPLANDQYREFATLFGISLFNADASQISAFIGDNDEVIDHRFTKLVCGSSVIMVHGEHRLDLSAHKEEVRREVLRLAGRR